MTRATRTPVSRAQALDALARTATDAAAVATVLNAFLNSSAIPDPVVVSLALRSRSLLAEATQHLDAAVQRLEQTNG